MKTVGNLISFIRFHIRQRTEDLSGILNTDILMFADEAFTSLCMDKKLKCRRDALIFNIPANGIAITVDENVGLRSIDLKPLITTLDSAKLLSDGTYIPITVITEKEYDNYQGFLNSEEYSSYYSVTAPTGQYCFLTSDRNGIFIYPALTTAITNGLKLTYWGLPNFYLPAKVTADVLPVIRAPFWEIVAYKTLMALCIGDENLQYTYKTASDQLSILFPQLAVDPDKVLLNRRTPGFVEALNMTATEHDDFE